MTLQYICPKTAESSTKVAARISTTELGWLSLPDIQRLAIRIEINSFVHADVVSSITCKVSLPHMHTSSICSNSLKHKPGDKRAYRNIFNLDSAICNSRTHRYISCVTHLRRDSLDRIWNTVMHFKESHATTGEASVVCVGDIRKEKIKI